MRRSEEGGPETSGSGDLLPVLYDVGRTQSLKLICIDVICIHIRMLYVLYRHVCTDYRCYWYVRDTYFR